MRQSFFEGPFYLLVRASEACCNFFYPRFLKFPIISNLGCVQYMHLSDEKKERCQLGIIGWPIAKLSKLTLEELYGRQKGEFFMRS